MRVHCPAELLFNIQYDYEVWNRVKTIQPPMVFSTFVGHSPMAS